MYIHIDICLVFVLTTQNKLFRRWSKELEHAYM